MTPQPLLIGITGASGAPYARALLEYLARKDCTDTSVIISHAGEQILRTELDLSPSADLSKFDNWLRLTPEQAARLHCLPIDDIGASPASGSNPLAAMAIVPCSMRTLAAVAHGLADNLLTRAADVCLKEGRRLVLAPRETPLSPIHLENMLHLSRLGVRIVPPISPFYHHPASIDDLIRFVTQKIVEQMGLEFDNPIRWEK